MKLSVERLMAVLLGLSIAANVVVVFAMLKHMRDVDVRERATRERLLNRIQAPETGVSQSLGDETPFVPSVGFDDDTEMLDAIARNGELT